MLICRIYPQPLIVVALEDSAAIGDEHADEQHALFGALVAQLADEASYFIFAFSLVHAKLVIYS